MKNKCKFLMILIAMFFAIQLCSCVPSDEPSNRQNDNNFDSLQYATEDEIIVNYSSVPYYGFSEKVAESSYYAELCRTASDNPDYIICDYKNGVCITDYKGKNKEVIIPETLDGKPVVKLGGHYGEYSEFVTAFDNSAIESVKLPSAVKYIAENSFHTTYDDTLEMIYVDDDNPYYSSKDGILYNKDMTVLLAVPGNYKSQTINISNGTKEVYEIISNNTLNLNIPESLEKININSSYPAWFYDSDFIFNRVFMSINVAENNKYFSGSDGVLYNKDKTELMIYPFAKSDKTFTVPDTVEVIDYFQLQDIPSLETWIFNKNIKTIKLDTDFDYDVSEQKAPKSITIKGYKDTASESWYNEQKEELWDDGLLTFVEIK